MIRVVISSVVCQLLGVCLAIADDSPYAYWISGEVGDWTTTNWADISEMPLPAPGYPTDDYWVEIGSGEVSITSQNVNIAGLCLWYESVLTVSDGKTLTIGNAAMETQGVSP